MKILDAGCGSGLVTKTLHNLSTQSSIQNLTFHGLDLTPAMLKRFQYWIEKKRINNIKLIQANVLKPKQLPPDWQHYDLIVVSGMLEYVPKEHIATAIKRLRHLLTPSGKLLIFICRRNQLAPWIIETCLP